MKVPVLPTEKYVNNAPRQTGALIAAAVGIILFWEYTKIEAPDKIIYLVFYGLPYRIIAAIWIYSIMNKLNREKRSTAFIAFFFPVCMLIMAGLSKKKNLAFTIDTSYTPKQQIEEIRAYAKGFIKQEKYTEAAFVYKYITAELPYTDEDVKTYNELLTKSKRVVPEFLIVEEK